jgi:hypothetical protein
MQNRFCISMTIDVHVNFGLCGKTFFTHSTLEFRADDFWHVLYNHNWRDMARMGRHISNDFHRGQNGVEYLFIAS